MAGLIRNQNSMETILTYDRDAQSQWSEVWSTADIPGIDNAIGGGGRSGIKERRKLRLGSLAFGAFLTMHSRIAASAITGGFFVFILFLIAATALLANPLRHFEVYMGQWSVSGPGRAYRILPVFEGVGLAVCINALIRAILCCTTAAIAILYVVNCAADAQLPYTYCRDFDLKPYDPILQNLSFLMFGEGRFLRNTNGSRKQNNVTKYFTAKIDDFFYLNISDNIIRKNNKMIEMCNESYSLDYPVLYNTPAYNFFFVEVVLYREGQSLDQFNTPLLFYLLLVWIVLWITLLTERSTHKKFFWNNTYTWLGIVPWIWTILLMFFAITRLVAVPIELYKDFTIGTKEVLDVLADALEVAIYIHSASLGTEMILGKNLNHYAMGHIDPHLNSEIIWHSGFLLFLTGLHSGGATICALIDSARSVNNTTNVQKSTLWIFPMYSQCTMVHNYSHISSTILFSGLAFSYMTVAFILIKTAIHIIFEYKVKFLFAERLAVTGTILFCVGLSVIFITTNGIALIESIDAVMSGVAMPFIGLVEIAPMLYVYRSNDFISDMHLATEQNACTSRIGTQWQIIPFILLITIVMKASSLWSAELPQLSSRVASALLAVLVLAPVLRAVRNAWKFFKSNRRVK